MKSRPVSILLGLTLAGYFAVIILDKPPETIDLVSRVVENFIVGYLAWLQGKEESS